MKNREPNIIHESALLYVYRTPKRLEIRVHRGTHSVTIGHGTDEAAVIRTAQRLERYPEAVRQAAGCP